MEDNRKGTWEDVTKECALELNGTGLGSYVTVRHNNNVMAHLGQVGEISGLHDKEEYRVTFAAQREGYTGHFTVEHFTPDPEPVIAYKAVIERDGEWKSVYEYGGFKVSTYTIGETVVSPSGLGIHCFGSLREAQIAYPADENQGKFARDDGRLAILAVEVVDKASRHLSGNDKQQKVCCYPSVKVLSVAWEEEKKEEWVVVTDECTFEKGSDRDDGETFISILPHLPSVCQSMFSLPALHNSQMASFLPRTFFTQPLSSIFIRRVHQSNLHSPRHIVLVLSAISFLYFEVTRPPRVSCGDTVVREISVIEFATQI